VEEFAKGLTALEIEIRPPRTEQITPRLSKKDLEVLRCLAAARGVGHRTLARTVLEGWLARSRSKDPSADVTVFGAISTMPKTMPARARIRPKITPRHPTSKTKTPR